MAVRKNNPAEPTGTATERVDRYYRTPKFKKGREWLERELGQMRLFEYNPADLKVLKVGDKWGVLLNSQVLKTYAKKTDATKHVNALKNRARKIQTMKKNPSNFHVIEIQPGIFGVFLGRNLVKKFRTKYGAEIYLRQLQNRSRRNPSDYEDLGDAAADGAREAIETFDFNDDGDVDIWDVEAFDDFGESAPLDAQIVIDQENELGGEIITVTPDGDLVVQWSDGEITVEDKDDLLRENGLKSWYLRQRAGSAYKKSLKFEERARKARGKQSELEKGLRGNPGWIGTLADVAVGTLSAMEIKDKLAKGQKRKGATSTVTKRNPSFSQMVNTARKAGKPKIAFLKANIAKVREYTKANGGSIRKHGIRYFYHLPKSEKNPAAVSNSGKKTVSNRARNNPAAKSQKKVNPAPVQSRKKTNPATRIKRNDAFQDFQGRPATKELELITPKNAPQRLWTLGKLLEIKVRGIGEPFDFRREATGRTFYLCADNRNRKLWIAGAKFAEKGEPEFIGVMDYIIYETQKLHLGDEHGESAYIHFLGEEGGVKPTLEVDADGFAHIIGGDYEITPLGIKD